MLLSGVRPESGNRGPAAAAPTQSVPERAGNGSGRTGARRRYLMCPPEYFDVVYSINPWMDPGRPANARLAVRQWERLHDLYASLGHAVEIIAPIRGLPDMVFTASSATVLDGRALVARYLHEERAAEAEAYLDWFMSRGFEVRQAAWTNEGEADHLAAGGWLLAGSGFRTDRRAHAESEEFFGRPVIGLTLVDDNYYHLATALTVLDEHAIMYHPGAFTAGSQAILRGLFPEAILATEEDAQVLGLNAVSDGHHVVLPAGATRLAGQLRERGFEPVPVDVSELQRAGGGVKCCTLELSEPALGDREAPAAGGLSVVVSSVASDSHNWNLVFLQLTLEELGHRVHNLGPCVPDEMLVGECRNIRPDLVVISTVNGHGLLDGVRLIAGLRRCPELAATPVVIGGKLGITGPGGRGPRDQLRAAGFDAVFEESGGMGAFLSFVEQLARSVPR